MYTRICTTEYSWLNMILIKSTIIGNSIQEFDILPTKVTRTCQ